MNREAEEKLVDFVAEQHRVFDPALWLERPHRTSVTPCELATVAQFLALTTFGHELPRPAWAGHKQTLLRLADEIDPENAGHDVAYRINSGGFDPSRFAGMLDAAVERLYQPER